MKSLLDFHRGIATTSGSALLITLAFVILLTVLIVGFLSRSLLEERISASSANQVKSDVFAQGVEATIIGDLEQEIINGSNTPVTAGSSTLYIPKTAANMVPMYDYPSCPSGSSGPAATLANLLKISTTSPVTGSTFPTAANALSTTPSLNGRSVSLSRWSETELIDPSATLPTPNWIMVARDASNPNTFSNAGSTDVTYHSSTKTNSKTVIGRFAYAIYDEGGLLDMNVAGYPTTVATGYALPTYIASTTSYRSGEATADLTQLTSSGSQLLSNAQIDTLIGWRNNASVSPPAPTGIVSTPANLLLSNATNYFSFVQSNSTGLLTTGNSSVYNNGSTYSTDQAFTSRYQLIQFVQALYGGVSPTAATLASANTALQYMTHFSRALSQPSVIPAVNNPNSVSPPSTPAYTSSTTDPATVGTNTANGNDKTINPSFLTVRVAGTVTSPPTFVFTRNDGSGAYAGDPLVRKRFNLNRLAWITYEGPLCDGHYTAGVAASASQITSNADLQIIANQLHSTYGLSWAFLQQGTAANIYNYFGLSWVADTRGTSPMPSYPIGDGQKKWYYYHPSGNTAPYSSLQNAGGNILTLANVSAANREPDMVELLLAGITVGSEAKSATLASQANTAKDNNGNVIRAGGPEDYQNSMDTSINFAIVQVMANIIDQYDLDGYPTRIIFNDGSLLPKEICGVENLPYVYRVRNGFLQCIPASYTEGVNSLSTYTPGLVTARGFGLIMQFPELWNPHDQSSPRCAINPSTGTYLNDSNGNPMFPTVFRVVADSIDPDHVIPTPAITANAANVLLGYPWNVYAAPTTPQLSSLQALVYDSSDPAGASGNGTNSQCDTSATYTDSASSPFTDATEMTSPRFPIFSENTALMFTMNESTTANNAGFFREPTMLINPGYPNGSGLTASNATYGSVLYSGGTYNPLNASIANPLPGPTFSNNDEALLINKSIGGKTYVNSGGVLGADGNRYIGFCMGIVPLAYYIKGTELLVGSGNHKVDFAEHGDTMDNRNYTSGKGYAPTQTSLTYRVQYYNSYDASPGWSTYDTKYANTASRSANDGGNVATGSVTINLLNTWAYNCAYDPRTSRFSMPLSEVEYPPGFNYAASYTQASWSWLNAPLAGGVLASARPDYNNGYWNNLFGGNDPSAQLPNATGFTSSPQANFGLLDQNNPEFAPTGAVASGKTSQNTVPTSTAAQYYADPDSVVRRGMAAYFSGNGTVGLPMATANTATNGVETRSGTQSQSRPIVLNRPFKSVADLGYVFSGTPWKNLDFNTPESGDASLLDLFTMNDTTDTNGLVAGKVDLNTQQIPVLQAVLAGAYKDEENNYSTTPVGSLSPLTSTEASDIATYLTKRTLATNPTASQGPLQNVSELVSKWVSSKSVGSYIDPTKSYAGFSSDMTGGSASNDLSTAFTAAGTTTSTTYIQRMRESAIRALSACGQTRVWNVMIDVVAQTGTYPSSATSFDQFAVQGEQRYWIHLAIDRLTGQVIDKQVEVVKE